MNLLSDLVKLYKNSEAPEIFFYWSGISVISAIVKKNVWLNRGGIYRLYPNTYCFLVAASGMKKGIPIQMAKKLITGVNNTRIISGRNSVQQVLEDLGKAHSIEGGGIIKEAHGYLISSELAAFLIKDPDALTILTDLHDTGYNKEWKYSLKSGKVTLAEPCISILGATNEEHFSTAVTNADVTGGFIARTFIVFSSEKGRLNPLVHGGEELDLKPIIRCLTEISKLEGEFCWTKESGEFYEQWYNDFHSHDHHDPTGTINRIGDQILKVAMCIGLAKGEFPNITLPTIREAVTRCLMTVNGMRQVTMGGKATLAAQTKLVIRELIILPDHRISRKKLLQKYWGQFDSYDLDKIAETLLQAGAIKILRSGSNIEYEMREEALEAYLNYKKSIN